MSTNYISQITASNGTTYDIQEGVTTRIFRATCSTANATAAKVATLDDSTGYSLAAGVRVAVTFTYGNTATSPTLNVNSGGAKYIYYRTDISSSQKVDELCVWGANETVIFTYNGSSWIMMGSSLALYNAYNKAASSGSGTITEVKTNAGAHTTIDVLSGKAEFNVPTTAAHVGAATSDHTHGNITNGGDITATAPTIANGDQIIINDNSASKITNGPTFDGSTTTKALTQKGTWETFSKFSGSYNDLSDKPTIPTNTDEKVKQTNSNTNNGRRILLSNSSNSTEETAGVYKSDYFKVINDTLYFSNANNRQATADAEGFAVFAQNTAYYSCLYHDVLRFKPNSYALDIGVNTLTDSRQINFPNASGTVALTSDIPTAPTITLNGTSTTSPSFYAPTAAGTSGYVLKSNGSGAPTWGSAELTDTKNTAGSTNSASKLYLIGATEQSANPQTYSNSNLYYDSINGFYVKSPTHSNSYSCIKQDNYGCTNIYAYSSSDDMPLSTILASSSEVFLGNRSLEMGYNSSISIIDGDIYLSTGANDKHVYIYNLGAPSNDTDAATKKYVDDNKGSQVKITRW